MHNTLCCYLKFKLNRPVFLFAKSGSPSIGSVRCVDNTADLCTREARDPVLRAAPWEHKFLTFLTCLCTGWSAPGAEKLTEGITGATESLWAPKRDLPRGSGQDSIGVYYKAHRVPYAFTETELHCSGPEYPAIYWLPGPAGFCLSHLN